MDERGSKRPAGTEDWTDEEFEAWRAQPWWRRYRLTLSPWPMIGALVIVVSQLGRNCSGAP